MEVRVEAGTKGGGHKTLERGCVREGENKLRLRLLATVPSPSEVEPPLEQYVHVAVRAAAAAPSADERRTTDEARAHPAVRAAGHDRGAPRPLRKLGRRA